MKRSLFIVAALGALVAGCGDNAASTLVYQNPTGGKLRLIRDPASSDGTSITLDLVVGDAPLTGYATGFDLPLQTRLAVAGFAPGTALDPGAPAAAAAAIPTTGPLTDNLVVALSQKASGDHAVTTDASLPAGAVLLKVTLQLDAAAAPGVIFDGTATGFVLPSGGLRDRAGNTVVEAKDVAIGKLEVAYR